jgi:hypothetical protein
MLGSVEGHDTCTLHWQARATALAVTLRYGHGELALGICIGIHRLTRRSDPTCLESRNGGKGGTWIAEPGRKPEGPGRRPGHRAAGWGSNPSTGEK